MTPIDLAAIEKAAEKLGYHHEHPVTGQMVLINPDGPSAAATILALCARIRELEDALKPFSTGGAYRVSDIHNARALITETDNDNG